MIQDLLSHPLCKDSPEFWIACQILSDVSGWKKNSFKKVLQKQYVFNIGHTEKKKKQKNVTLYYIT